MAKYVILAATGQIGQMTTQYLLDNSDSDLVLFGHDATQRLSKFAGPRVSFVDGDLKDTAALKTLLVPTRSSWHTWPHRTLLNQ